jgi:hypothetical protein
MIRVEDHGGIFAFNRGKMKGEALAKAQEFAQSQNMVAVPLAMNEHPVGVLGDWAAVEYQFRLVPPNSNAAHGSHLQKRADLVIEDNQNINVNQRIQKEDDIYGELMKLDNLRKQGILTEDEYNNEKQKILNR